MCRKCICLLYIIIYESDASIKVKNDSVTISNQDYIQYNFFDGTPLSLHYTKTSSGINIISGVITAKQDWYFMIAKLQKYYTVTIKFEIVYF